MSVCVVCVACGTAGQVNRATHNNVCVCVGTQYATEQNTARNRLLSCALVATPTPLPPPGEDTTTHTKLEQPHEVLHFGRQMHAATRRRHGPAKGGQRGRHLTLLLLGRIHSVPRGRAALHTTTTRRREHPCMMMLLVLVLMLMLMLMLGRGRLRGPYRLGTIPPATGALKARIRRPDRGGRGGRASAFVTRTRSAVAGVGTAAAPAVTRRTIVGMQCRGRRPGRGAPASHNKRARLRPLVVR